MLSPDILEAMRALRGGLAACYPDATDARRILFDAGVDPRRVITETSPENRWFEALLEVEAQGRLGEFCDAVRREYPNLPGLGALRARAAGAPGPPAVGAPGSGPPPRKIDFIGRAAELAAMEAALLRDASVERVCVLHGMPGVGKSYLVEQFAATHADRLPRGYALVRLEGAGADLDEVLTRIAEQVGVPARDARDHGVLRARLRDGMVHFEGLDDEGAAPLALRVATALWGCPIVITTRLRYLGFDKRWPRVHVTGFDEADSLALLRAEGVSVEAREAAALRALVRRVGGLPLALHLVAGLLSTGRAVRVVDDMLDRAGDLSVDATSPRSLREPLRFTLSVLRASLLRAAPGRAEDLMAGLAALGFAPPTGVGRSLGAALTGLGERDYADLISRASALSIVDVVPGVGVVRVHPLFAALLREGGSEAAASARVAAWFEVRTTANPALDRADAASPWQEALDEVWSLIAWLDRAAPSAGARIALAASEFVLRCGPYVPWIALLERSLVASAPPERPFAALLLAQLQVRAGNLQRAEALASEVEREASRNLFDPNTARAAGLLAEVFYSRGDVAGALDKIVKVQRPLLERLGLRGELADAIDHQAEVLARAGALAESVSLRRLHQIPLLRALGHSNRVADALGKIAGALQAQGRWSEASRILREEVIPIVEASGDERARIAGRLRIAEGLFAAGDQLAAAKVLEEGVVQQAERLGDERLYTLALARVADARYLHTSYEDAEQMRREHVLPRLASLSDPHLRFQVLHGIVETYLARGHFDRADRAFRERLLAAAEGTGARRSIALAHNLRARTLVGMGRRKDAVRALRDLVLPTFDASGYERDWLQVQAHLARLLLAESAVSEALGAAYAMLPVATRAAALDHAAPTIDDVGAALAARDQLDDAISLRRGHLACAPYRGDLGVRARSLMAAAADCLRRARADDRAEATRMLREARLCILGESNPIADEVDAFIARHDLAREVEDATVRVP